MRDDLVGFLTGALDASEHDEIKRKLDVDPALQDDLQRIERCLTPLSWDKADYTPPADLTARTCDLVANFIDTGGVLDTPNHLASHLASEATPNDLAPSSKADPKKMKSAQKLSGFTLRILSSGDVLIQQI